MDIGVRGTGNWRLAVLCLGLAVAALTFAITCYIKGLAVGFTIAGTIITIVTAAAPVAASAVKWARSGDNDKGLKRETAVLTGAFARYLREFSGAMEAAEWRAWLPRWPAADIEEYFSGARLAPWESCVATPGGAPWCWRR